MSNSEKLSEKEVWSPVERTLLPADPQKLSEDPYKHLNYLDQQDGFMFAAWGFMEKRGFGMDQWHRKFGMKVFVRHLEIDFLKELKKKIFLSDQRWQ